MSNLAYFSDTRLLSRVREYLKNYKSHTPIAIHVIADDLQHKYREYERKKKNAFKKLIEKACLVVHEEDGIHGKVQFTGNKSRKRKKGHLEEDSCSDSFSSDDEDCMDGKGSNAMNSMMSSMYRKVHKKQQISDLSSRTTSGGVSPHRTDIGTQEPSLGRSLFVIDKTGDKDLGHSAKKTPKTKPPNIDSDTRKARGDVNSNERVVVIMEHNDDVRTTKEDMYNSTVSSPMSLDATYAEATTAGEMTDAVSVKADKRTKKVKKKTDKTKKKLPEVEKSSITFASVGGNEKTIQEVCKLLVHMKHPEVYKQLGVQPPRGFLLHGPPGCGKTLLAHAIAGELDLPFIKLAATEIVSGVSGESEEKLRDIFEQAVNASPCILFMDEIDAITQRRENASKDMERRIVAQLLTCMDDLNSKADVQVIVIGATNREDSLDPALRRAGRFDREICMGIPDEKARIGILQVLCKDLRLTPEFDFIHLARSTPGFVGADLMALAREAAMTAVNRVFTECQAQRNALKSDSLRIDGGFRDAQTSTPKASSSILPENAIQSNDNPQLTTETTAALDHSASDKTNSLNIQPNCENSSRSSRNMNESDVETNPGDGCTDNLDSCDHMSSEVLSVLDWLRDQPPLTAEQMADLYISMPDFTEACKVVQPSAKREGFATIPGVTWDDIGALSNVREELEMAILAPVRHPEQFQALGITSPAGVLLAGPPGCGKTLLAKAVANESGLNFISVKGPELLNMYVGESERAVRQVFTRARNSAPCVIFFDELDALCPRRTGSSEGGSSARVVNQLLTEMDGLEERKQVFIMGATNRPDIIDPAVLRPGRLDKMIYVGFPNQKDRCDILRTLTKNGTRPLLAEDVNLADISDQPQCQCYTGADLAALVREASVLALKDVITGKEAVGPHPVSVSRMHFDLALDKIKPSVSAKEQEKYERMKKQFTVS